MLRKAARVAQGDPAEDGFEVRGDQITLMLLPAGPDTSRIRVARAVAARLGRPTGTVPSEAE